MTITALGSDRLGGEQEDHGNIVVQPTVPNQLLAEAAPCSCGNGNMCDIHSFVSVEEIAEVGKDRLSDPNVLVIEGKIRCYRSVSGWIPELRQAPHNDEDVIRQAIWARIKKATPVGVLFRGDEGKKVLYERFSDVDGEFPPVTPTGSQKVLTAHADHKDVHGRYPHAENDGNPSYLRVARAQKVIVPTRPNLTVLGRLNEAPIEFRSVPTDVQTLATFDPEKGIWTSQTVPYGEISADHWQRIFHYPDGFITGMVYYQAEDGIYGFRVDKHIDRAVRDAKRREFEGVDREFLQQMFAQHLSGDKRWIPKMANQPGNRYYGRFIGYPTNAAPPLRAAKNAAHKEMLFLGTPVGPYRNLDMLRIKDMGMPRPVIDRFANIKHVTNYAGPVGAFAPHQDAGFHEAMFMKEQGYLQRRVQEGTSVNYAFVSTENGKTTVRIPTLSHGDILPGITMQSVAELVQSYGYDVVMDREVVDDHIGAAEEILVTGTAMTVRGVSEIIGADNDVRFKSKHGQTMGPVARRLADDLKAILERRHPDPKFNGWMQKIVSF